MRLRMLYLGQAGAFFGVAVAGAMLLIAKASSAAVVLLLAGLAGVTLSVTLWWVARP